MQYEWEDFEAQEFSKLYFYSPSTVDRNEKINQYLTSVNLKPFDIDLEVFGESFNPADSNFFDCNAIISYMKRVADQNSHNLKRNGDTFLASMPHDNKKLLWPGGKRTQSDKFSLTY